MFGKGKLLREGAEIDGVVADVSTHMVAAYGATSHGTVGNNYRVKVRVSFEDGSTAETSAGLHLDEVGLLNKGDAVPVRYDPADHSKVEIDVPALKARRDARLSAGNEALEQVQGWRGQVKPGHATERVSRLAADVTSSSPDDLKRAAIADPEAFRKQMFELRDKMTGASGGPAVVGQEGLGALAAAFGASSPPTGADPVDQLAKLAELRDRGVLTQEEFEVQKRRILDESS
jgi:Short C-terminal domain